MRGRFQFSIRAMLAATAAIAGAMAFWRIPPNSYSLALVLLVVAAAPPTIGVVLCRARGNVKAFCQVAIFPAIMALGTGVLVVANEVFGMKADLPSFFDRIRYTRMCEGTDTVALAQDNLLAWLGLSILAGIFGILIRHPDADKELDTLGNESSP